MGSFRQFWDARFFQTVGIGEKWCTIYKCILKTSQSEHSHVQEVLDEVIAHIRGCADCSEKTEMLESIRSETPQPVHVGLNGRQKTVEEREAFIESFIIRPGQNKFCELIGHDEVKLLLVQSLALPIKQPQLFDNVPPCRRILLYGPPGKGSALCVRERRSED